VFFLVVSHVPIVVCSRHLIVGKASTSLQRSTFSSTLNIHASTGKKTETETIPQCMKALIKHAFYKPTPDLVP